MKKLNILKNIVDIIWIISLPIIPLGFVFIVMLCIGESLENIQINLFGNQMSVIDTLTRVLLVVSILSFYLIIYSIYLFKKTLQHLVNEKVFDSFVIKSYNTIGVLIVVFGIIALARSITTSSIYKKTISIGFGINPYFVIIGLGFFFMVLSEIFKIAKNAKQENDLTI